MRDWAGYIKFADHFLGCDSVGQHLAKSVNQRSTVIMGGTFPINASYPNDDKFTVFDLGKDRRVYDPIRIAIDKKTSEANKGIMKMDDVTIDKIIPFFLRYLNVFITFLKNLNLLKNSIEYSLYEFSILF